ncbi:hypothetical protein L1887_62132 [Cichorium endivia]|nr:hypothetical protein L1887_62132 [Cichorium endivia]
MKSRAAAKGCGGAAAHNRTASKRAPSCLAQIRARRIAHRVIHPTRPTESNFSEIYFNRRRAKESGRQRAQSEEKAPIILGLDRCDSLATAASHPRAWKLRSGRYSSSAYRTC